MLKDIGLSEQQFAEACENASGDAERKKIIDQLINIDDYIHFKKLMVRRNLELKNREQKFCN